MRKSYATGANQGAPTTDPRAISRVVRVRVDRIDVSDFAQPGGMGTWSVTGWRLTDPPLDVLFCWPNPRAAHFWSKLGRRLNGSEWLAANPDLAYVLDPTVKP